jgi:hypothetical protein
MPPGSEVLGNESIRRQNTLGMTRGFEPLHATLALARRPMRVLAPVMEITTLTMRYLWKHLALGRAVALQLVGHDAVGHIPQALEQLAKELLGGLLVPPALHQAIEDVGVLIHRSPQVMTPAVDGQTHRIEMPLVTWPRPSASEPIGIVLPKLQTPLPDSFIGHLDAAFEQELLHVAVAQLKAIVAPDPVTDDVAGKAVIFVGLGVGGRGYAWLPLCACGVMDHGGRQRGDYVMGSGGRPTT